MRFWVTRTAGADEGGQHRERQPGERVHGGGQHVTRAGPTMKTDLVDHRLEGEGGEQVAWSVDQVRPAGPDGGADLGQAAPATAREQVRPGRRPSASTAAISPTSPSGEEPRAPPAAPGSGRAGRSAGPGAPRTAALAMRNAAETAPASAVGAGPGETSSTIPRLTIAIGSRATSPAHREDEGAGEASTRR